MTVEVGLLVGGGALVLVAGVLTWRRIRSIRRSEAIRGVRGSTVRDTALVAGAFCAIVVVVTATALDLR